MKIRWHCPGCVTAEPRPDGEFNTLDELKEIAARFIHGSFVEFTVSKHAGRDGNGEWLILATYDEGYEWWVVGYITGVTQADIDAIGLSEWVFKEREVPNA